MVPWEAQGQAPVCPSHKALQPRWSECVAGVASAARPRHPLMPPFRKRQGGAFTVTSHAYKGRKKRMPKPTCECKSAARTAAG